MPYTNSGAVQALLGPRDYDGATDLQQYIDSADILIANIPSYAASRGFSVNSSQLEIIERWLAAHMFKMNTPQFQSISTGGVSVQNTGASGLHLTSSRYGQMAMMLDYSGYLSSINNRALATANWLGTKHNCPVPQPIPPTSG